MLGKYIAQMWGKFRGVGIGFLAKSLVVILNLAITRLLINLGGLEGMAACAILASLTTWIALFNLGMPFAVNGLVSKYRAEERDYLDLKAAALDLVVIFAIAFMPLMFGIGLIVKTVLLKDFIYIDPLVVGMACFFMLLSGLMQVLFQLLFAEYQPTWPNIFPAISSCIIFIGLLILEYNNIRNINIILFINFIPSAIGFISLLIIFKPNLKIFPEKKYFNEILKSSKGYMLYAILSATTLSVDYIILSRLIYPDEITIYNLLNKVFGIIITLNSILIINEWAKMGDRLHAKRYEEAHDRIRTLLIFSIISAIIGCALIATFMNEIMYYLTGEIININIILIIEFIVYILVRLWTDIYSMAVMSFSKLSLVNSYIPFQAIISILAQYTFVKFYGLSGIILGILLSYIMTAVWILPYYFYKSTKLKIA